MSTIHGKIVAIGGGELREHETLSIDRHIVELTGKNRPHALFIPTASGDAPGYVETFRSVYGGVLGCDVGVLNLLSSVPQSMTATIDSADLIYVGGGNTLRMMRRWRKLGVDALLRQAHERGVVLSGLSAGAICWFAGGHSDSKSFYDPDSWDFIKVSGLGLIDALYCPHIDSEARLPKFQAFMRKYNQVGIGCDDGCALEVIGDHYRILASKSGAKAYKLSRQRGEVVTQILQPFDHPRPLADLLTK
jgi:dipeptidase E